MRSLNALAAMAALLTPIFSQSALAQPRLADPPGVAARLAEAQSLAGDLYRPVQQHLCDLHSPEDDARLAARRAKAPLGPTKVFDNLYYVGVEEVGAWALTTSQGIILFDSLDNPDEAQSAIVEGLGKLSLDPKSVKLVVVTHGHGDHFGGADYLKRKLGAGILMSAVDWDYIKDHPGPRQFRPFVPAHDQDITDGEHLTLGDTTVVFHITPGHTPGTVSSIFQVRDHGVPHVLAFWGGVGVPAQATALKAYIASDDAFHALATAAGAEIGITNHPHADMSLEWVTQIKEHPQAVNPFLVGRSGVDRWFGVIKACAQAQEERLKANVKPMGRSNLEGG